VLDAAGFRSQVCLGAWTVLRHLVAEEKLSIFQYCGGSAGGQGAVMMAADMVEEWVSYPFGFRALRNKYVGQKYGFGSIAWLWLRGGVVDVANCLKDAMFRHHSDRILALPHGTYWLWVKDWAEGSKLLSGLPTWTWSELGDALMATGAIPGVSCGFYQPWCSHWCYDGGFNDMGSWIRIPALPYERPQIHFSTGNYLPEDSDSSDMLWAVWCPTEAVQAQAIRYGQDMVVELLEKGACVDEKTGAVIKLVASA